jgi:hypothetical protein
MGPLSYAKQQELLGQHSYPITGIYGRNKGISHENQY